MIYPYPPGAAATSGGPHFTESVGFQISTNYWDPNGTGPWVDLMRYQNGRRVLYQHEGYFAGTDHVITLGPTAMWTSGEAHGTATDISARTRGRFQPEAGTSFHVAA